MDILLRNRKEFQIIRAILRFQHKKKVEVAIGVNRKKKPICAMINKPR